MAICVQKEIVEKGRKKERKNNIYCLPEEIIENILLRVSATDVANFLKVCNSWISLLSNPEFVTSHDRRSDSHKEVEEILLTTVAKPTLYSDKYQYDNFLLNPLDLNSPLADKDFHDQPKTLLLLSSCRGILLFQDRYSPNQLYVTNPLLKYRMAVPPTPTPSCSQWTLVYDPLKHVYKIVGFYDNSMHIFTDSHYWQSYTDLIDSDYYQGEVLSQFFCMGEELHWLSTDIHKSSRQAYYYIISMHISTETFSKTRVPGSIEQSVKNDVDSSIRTGMHLLTDLEGCLCLTIVLDNELRVRTLLNKTESRWSITHIVSLRPLYNHPNLRTSSFIHDDICIIGLKSVYIRDMFKILIHQDDQVYCYDLTTYEFKPIAHLSKDKKLCRSYMLHSNRLAFFMSNMNL